MRRIIMIIGPKGSGKTYKANKFKEQYGESARILSISDSIKSEAGELVDLNLHDPKVYDDFKNTTFHNLKGFGKPLTGREMMISIGEERRTYNPYFWVMQTIDSIEHDKNHSTFIIDDLRTIEEYEAIKTNFSDNSDIKIYYSLYISNRLVLNTASTEPMEKLTIELFLRGYDDFDLVNCELKSILFEKNRNAFSK